jgi:hypothetical protein
MDLGLYLRVLWRFRALVVAGVLLSATVAFLSFVRVDLDGGVPKLSYRSAQTWASTSTLLVSQEGFPWGATILQSPVPLEPGEQPKGPLYSDPSRFEGLAVLYAKFAQSDDVRTIIAEDGPLPGAYTAAPGKTDEGAYLPFVTITGVGTAPGSARRVAARATEGFREYLVRTQEANDIPPNRRVELEVVNSPAGAALQSGRSPVKPMFILLIGLGLTVGLAFVLENLRPRAPEAVAQSAQLPAPAEVRRTARSG